MLASSRLQELRSAGEYEALASIVALALAYWAKRAFDHWQKHPRKKRHRVRGGQARGIEMHGSQLRQPLLGGQADGDGAALPSTCWDLSCACFDDADDDDAEDEGVRGSLAEVLDSAVGAGIGVVEDAVAAIADAEDGDLGT